MLGPEIVGLERRPATMRTLRLQNGPGHGGSEIRDGVAYKAQSRLRRRDPAGTGHWFTKIDDHIDYLMIRIDPDKVTPTKIAEESKEWLAKPAPPEGG